MLTCKQVHRALARADYARLPLWKRIGLRAHIRLCWICGPYNRQVVLFQDMFRRLRNEEPPAAEGELPLERKRAMQATIDERIHPPRDSQTG